MSNPNQFGSNTEGDAPAGDWPPNPLKKSNGNGNEPPEWAKKAVVAAAAVGVVLLGVVIIKKKSGKSDDEVKEELRSAASDAKHKARKGAEKAKEAGRDVWGLSKEKARDVKDDFPGQTEKLAHDVKTAVWEGGKDAKRGAQIAASKVSGVFQEEVKPNYGILGWRHIFNNPK